MSLTRTRDLIEEFERNTDCKIVLVDQYKDLMKQHISIPQTIIHSIIPSRYEKTFNDLIARAMEELESRKIKNSGEEEKDEIEMSRGSPEYDSFNNQELQFLNKVLMSLHDSAELAREELELNEHEPSLPSVKKILEGIRTLQDIELTKEKLFLETLNEYKVLNSQLLLFY